MRASIKSLMATFQLERETARRIYALMQHKEQPNTKWIDAIYKPYNPYNNHEYTMLEIDQLLDGYGVEYITHLDDTHNKSFGYSYVNMGESYAPTIVYNHMRRQYSISCWGDIVESNSKLGASQ